ncbi:hypothetical protein ACLQ2S_24355 [Micromonospora sp. DT48]|uniref:hypothetical protein n=1 Tax=Micromonospora sp. DT48 TaxID=3393429 RepID=UPI003CE6F2BE
MNLTPMARNLLTTLVGGAVVLLAACQSGPDTAGPRPDAAGSAATATPPASPPARAATDAELTAPQRLTVLADTLPSTPGDSTTTLPYAYLHTQTWNRATNTIVRTDLQRWRHTGNHSGRDVIRTAPDLRGVHRQPTRPERSLFDDAEPRTIRYRPGELHPPLPETFPADPDTLIAHLVPPELAAEPAYPRLLVDSVVRLATDSYLDQQQRAATLNVLAAVPGITYRGTTTDLAGRTGMSFQVVADRSTSTLIIDPVTGELLSAAEQVDGPRPGLFKFVLVLARGHSATDHDLPSTPGSKVR